MSRTLSLIVLGALLAAPALASKIADDCVRAKVWDRYGDGWQVRASTDTDIGFGHTHYYRVSMLKGRTYQIVTCADENVSNLDILLYDADGAVLTRDATEDREPTITFAPEKTGVHYVVMYVRGAKDTAVDNEVGMAIIHQ